MVARCAEVVHLCVSSGSATAHDVRSLGTANVQSATAVLLETGGLCRYGAGDTCLGLRAGQPRYAG